MNADFELMMIEGIVYGYAADLADAWLDNDLDAIERISDHIRGNYGQTALNHVGELAVVIAAQS